MLGEEMDGFEYRAWEATSPQHLAHIEYEYAPSVPAGECAPRPLAWRRGTAGSPRRMTPPDGRLREMPDTVWRNRRRHRTRHRHSAGTSRLWGAPSSAAPPRVSSRPRTAALSITVDRPSRSYRAASTGPTPPHTPSCSTPSHGVASWSPKHHREQRPRVSGSWPGTGSCPPFQKALSWSKEPSAAAPPTPPSGQSGIQSTSRRCRRRGGVVITCGRVGQSGSLGLRTGRKFGRPPRAGPAQARSHPRMPLWCLGAQRVAAHPQAASGLRGRTTRGGLPAREQCPWVRTVVLVRSHLSELTTSVS